MDPDTSCCHRNCFDLWKTELGYQTAEAVIITELSGYAALSEAGRQQHFLSRLKSMATVITARSIDRGEKDITGESVADRMRAVDLGQVGWTPTSSSDPPTPLPVCFVIIWHGLSPQATPSRTFGSSVMLTSARRPTP